MTVFILQAYRLFKALFRIFGDPRGRALLGLVGTQLLVGTVFFALVEGWRWLDSLYFSVTTLTTVGLGDFAPSTDAGKVFMIVYVLSGVGVLVSFLSLVAEKSLADQSGEGQAVGNRSAPDRSAPDRSGPDGEKPTDA